MGFFFSRRWVGEPRQEKGHVSPEAGEAGTAGAGGQGRAGEPGRYELAQQGAVGGGEEQDRHGADTVRRPPPFPFVTRIKKKFTSSICDVDVIYSFIHYLTASLSF